jgi:SAM-dependent methyltransferase
MISTATSTTAPSAPETYQVLDCTLLRTIPALQKQSFTKVFSSAALHWILRQEPTRRDVFLGAYNALAPGGKLIFEMGGQGNVAELRAALLSVVGRRVGIEKAREVDPWFFPDKKWMGDMLESAGFVVEKMELEYRPTRAEEGGNGGLEGWMRLMGKNFLDLLGEVEREEAVKEICEVLETVSKGGDGGYWMGYVRLRVVARKN